MVCDHLERWDRESGREGDTRGKRYGDICISITESLCYIPETNTTLQITYASIKKKKSNIPGNQLSGKFTEGWADQVFHSHTPFEER